MSTSVDYLDDCGKESGRLQKETRVPCGGCNQREGPGDPAQEESRAAGRLGFILSHVRSPVVRARTEVELSLWGRQVWPHKEARLKGTSLRRGGGGWEDGVIRGRLAAWLTVMATVMAMGVPGDSPASGRVLKGTEGAGLLLDWTGNERGTGD